MKRFQSIFLFLPLILCRPVFAQFNGDGLRGVYYIGTNLSSASVTEVDPVVSYRWYGCPPQPGMSGASFSVRWTGQLDPSYSEPYTIYADVAGAVSLIVNGTVLVSHWTDTGPGITRYSGVITLTADTPVPIEVDYFTNGAAPVSDLIQLGWQSPSQAQEYIPRQYLFSGAPLNPTPTPQTPSACQSSASGITVDGALSEWPWTTGGGWNNVNRTAIGNTYSTSASFKTLWDSTNLYLGVTVLDSTLTTGDAIIYDNSTVELYLDTTDSRSITLAGTDYEYFFEAGVTTPAESMGRTTGVTVGSATIPGGYVVEASIPWSTLGVSSPNAGTVMGLDIGVDVDHNGQCRDGQLIWNGGADDYSNTSGYAQLSLASACPTPVATPPPTGGNPYVSPNPSNGGSVQFVYTMAQAGTANIKVWNAWGNLAATINEPKGAGEQSSVLNVTSFAPGHYFYRIELDYGQGKADVFKTQVLAVKK